jgi:DNA-directed RNA polymerase sigma subunit (sigma70/sigma32)
MIAGKKMRNTALTRRDVTVIRMRKEGWQLKDIGDRYGVSRARAHQLVMRALLKLEIGGALKPEEWHGTKWRGNGNVAVVPPG